MKIDLFEQIKVVLIDNGWQYFFEHNLWTTGKTMNGTVLTNDVLISIMDTDSASSIGFFFTYILKKPSVLKNIYELLPNSFFDESGIQA